METTTLPMIAGYGLVLAFMAAGVLFILIALVLQRFISTRHITEEKMLPYECGEDVVGSPWVQFNIRFYIFALVFLIFDVELAFLLPWAVAYRNPALMASYGWMAFWDGVIFIGILVVGLIYLWARGDLRWVRPRPDVETKEPDERDLREREMLLGKVV